MRHGAARVTLSCIAALLVLCSQAAAEPTISVVGSDMGQQYRQVIDRLVSQIDKDVALAAQSSNDTPALYFDLNGPLDRIPGFNSMAPGDQALLRATKLTYDLFRLLGGEILDRYAMLQRENNRYYIAVDGEGGRWVVSVEEALAFLLDELVSSNKFTSATRSAGAQCPSFHCLLLATYTGMIEAIASVPRDTTVTLELTADDFNEAIPPVLLVPDSMVVHDLITGSDGTITATISVHETASLGMHVLSVYEEGHAFRSLARFGLEVLASPSELLDALASDTAMDGTSGDPSNLLTGTGDYQPLVDDHTALTASATLLTGTASGRLGSVGDVDLFKIIVEQAGTLSVTSDGPTDVVGTLETDEGAVIAVNDDGGTRYNFLLEQSVTPGTYYLRVTHCCSGQGDYRLSTNLTP